MRALRLALLALVRSAAGEQMTIDAEMRSPVEPAQRALRSVKRWGSEWAANTAALKADLLANYPDDSNIVPPLDDEPVSVNVQFMPISINSVDTVGHTFSIFGWWRIWWSDERLAWNASQYGGVDTVYFTGSKAEGERRVWMPDLGVYESVGGPLSTVQDINIRALSDGSLYICQPSIYTVPCAYNEIKTEFPFDQNKCGGVNRFTLGSWVHSSQVISLRPAMVGQGELATRAERASLEADASVRPEPVQCDAFTQRADYKLKRINVEFSVQMYGSLRDVSYPTLAFEFVLVRSTADSSGRINVGIVWPLFLTCLLSIVVPYLAPDECINTGVTCLLAESALFLVTASSLTEPGRITQLFFNLFVITFFATVCGMLSTVINNAVKKIRKMEPEEKEKLLVWWEENVNRARRLKAQVRGAGGRLRSTSSTSTSTQESASPNQIVPFSEPGMDAESVHGEETDEGSLSRQETHPEREVDETLVDSEGTGQEHPRPELERRQSTSLSDDAIRQFFLSLIEKKLPALQQHMILLKSVFFFVLIVSWLIFFCEWMVWRDDYYAGNKRWIKENARCPEIVYCDSGNCERHTGGPGAS